MKKKAYICFIVLCMIILLVPFVGMTVQPTNETTENKTLMEFPELRNSEGFNQNFLSDMGDYFQEHFAFRQQFVSMNAAIYGKIFGVSTTDQVLIGKNNWMYYTGTLNDYQSENLLSDRGIKNAVHNLKLIQNYVNARGSKFIFAIAPNKNSIYDENMPYYYRGSDVSNNYERLIPELEKAGIQYVDLKSVFQKSDEILYLERDSHWNNKGAVLAYNEIMGKTDLVYETYENIPYETRKDHLGDLTKMLYPLNSELENNQYYQKDWSWNYVDDVKDNMDEWIETKNSSAGSSLLMYRDSFGESLLPFMAEAFGEAYFSRLVPYNLTNIDQYRPEYVVMERVERRISSFASEAPIMEAPMVKLEVDTEEDADIIINVKAEGDYYTFDGIVDSDRLKTESQIFVVIRESEGTSKIYVPFWISEDNGIESDYGFKMYLRKNHVPSAEITVDILVMDDNQIIRVGEKKIDLSLL